VIDPRHSSRHGAGRTAPALRAVLLALALGLGGCSVLEPRPLDVALFPTPGSLPANREAARVLLSLSEPAQSDTSPSVAFRAARVQLPIGRIVEAAAQLALREQFESVTSGPTAEPGLRMVLSNVAPETTSHLIYEIPVPGGVIDRVDVSSRLSFSLTVLAPDGRPRWSRDHDSGRERVLLMREHLWAPEPLQSGMQRALREQAARLMRLAAADLRAWGVQERMRERVL
jgi:hypothetical protein